jgi:ABC-2 type transport system permease protein
MSRAVTPKGRLSLLAAAFVVARRDFTAILFSRSFFFFLLGPLFPVAVGALAGSLGDHIDAAGQRPVIGVAMPAADAEKLIAAGQMLAPGTQAALPDLRLVQKLAPGQSFDARAALSGKLADLGAVVTGTLAHPVLTGPGERIEQWQAPLALVAARAADPRAPPMVPVALSRTHTASSADVHKAQVTTAQAGQTLLFLLTMLLAGMVLSNLVEEKGNKIIEVLAAAIPMDAVFLGKLVAMLAVSWVGIFVWGLAGFALTLALGNPLHALAAPAVGWPAFLALGVVYFSLGYLILGSLFLAIGSMATTVREVQTLSMPVTMLQLVVFFFASYAMTHAGSPVELAAIVIPFSSPFAMLARGAMNAALWPHLLAIVWQIFAVGLFIKLGAGLFRKRVMKSGPSGGKPARKWLFSRG